MHAHFLIDKMQAARVAFYVNDNENENIRVNEPGLLTFIWKITMQYDGIYHSPDLTSNIVHSGTAVTCRYFISSTLNMLNFLRTESNLRLKHSFDNNDFRKLTFI